MPGLSWHSAHASLNSRSLISRCRSTRRRRRRKSVLTPPPTDCVPAAMKIFASSRIAGKGTVRDTWSVAGVVRIGTSGWVYPHWRERFYPKGLPQTRWLEYYSERFDTVELNNPFYRQPARATFERWRRAVPETFVYAVKLNRYLTHIKRLDVDRRWSPGRTTRWPGWVRRRRSCSSSSRRVSASTRSASRGSSRPSRRGEDVMRSSPATLPGSPTTRSPCSG